MKTVPLFYWMHGENVTQNFAKMIDWALSRHGFNVIHICASAPDFHENLQNLFRSRQIAFGFSLTHAALNLHVNNAPIWDILPIKYFVYLLDAPIYYINSPLMQKLLFETENKLVFGLPDADYQSLLSEAARRRGKPVSTMFLPFGAMPPHLCDRPWAERDLEISIFGNVGRELSAQHIRETVEESFRSYDSSMVSLETLIAVVNEILNNPTSGNVTLQLMKEFNLKAEDVLFDLRWQKLSVDVDSLIKRYRRLQIVRKLSGHKINAFGAGWDQLAGDIPGLVIHGSRKYEDQHEIFRRSRLGLNVDPNWDFGVHDRVFNTAVAGAVSLTQHNRFATSALPHAEACLCYAQNGDDIADVVAEHHGRLEEIALEGLKRTNSLHAWDQRILQVTEYLSS
ncbi:conserved protein of unknown function [Rhodovastum atsumiense]|uniref:Spore protein YkvP/CgeB glycosyl transferase-like domain-containing protein n=1 Tax=Rhodovastum atsumiense TaxID=504468 RepID=A0A5M6IV35_9PROT|nr:hypothetical protein [Rhodovastum atsumiense]KAA5612081.1 hypothetical protein F1189_11535 [Rhodovastum atsumiense]CAH2604045.1 conserved protein of unknown function [Rhodovastum atsumiense]